MSPKIVTLKVFFVSLLLGTTAFASSKKGQSGMIPGAAKPKLSTDIHFDGVNVTGRRQSPFGATAVVESDKKTPNLIDYRSNYDDRIARSKSGR